MSEAAVKGAADLKFVGGHVAKHKAGFNVLGPGVADIGGVQDGHLSMKKPPLAPMVSTFQRQVAKPRAGLKVSVSKMGWNIGVVELI